MTQATDLNQLSTEQLRERHKQLENQLVQMRADIERLKEEFRSQNSPSQESYQLNRDLNL